MRAMSSDQIGEVFHTLRDRLPQSGRQVRFAAKIRTEFSPPDPRPSRDVPPPREIPRNDVARANQACLKDIERGLWKSGTGPKFTVKRKAEPKPAPPKVEIAGLLGYSYTYVREQIARLEPLPGCARVHTVLATFCGPLTRRQQAEYAYICANYGVIYVHSLER